MERWVPQSLHFTNEETKTMRWNALLKVTQVALLIPEPVFLTIVLFW